MSHVYKLPLRLEPQPEGGYTVTSPVLPGLITEGETVAEHPIPLCSMPAGTTCHRADEAGCHEPRRKDRRLETLRHASGDICGVPSFCGLIEGQRPALDDTAGGLLNHSFIKYISNAD
jgi:hypothetical protein